MTKYLGVIVLGLCGGLVGVYLAGTVAIDSLPKIASYQPVWQNIQFSQGQTKLFPDFQVQRAASIQGTLGVE